MAAVCARYAMHPDDYWDLTNEDHNALVEHIQMEARQAQGRR